MGYDATNVAKWGTVEWLDNNGEARLVDTVFNAKGDMVDYSLSILFQSQHCASNYLRIQVDYLHLGLRCELALDGVGFLQLLVWHLCDVSSFWRIKLGRKTEVWWAGQADNLNGPLASLNDTSESNLRNLTAAANRLLDEPASDRDYQTGKVHPDLCKTNREALKRYYISVSLLQESSNNNVCSCTDSRNLCKTSHSGSGLKITLPSVMDLVRFAGWLSAERNTRFAAEPPPAPVKRAPPPVVMESPLEAARPQTAEEKPSEELAAPAAEEIKPKPPVAAATEGQVLAPKVKSKPIDEGITVTKKERKANAYVIFPYVPRAAYFDESVNTQRVNTSYVPYSEPAYRATYSNDHTSSYNSGRRTSHNPTSRNPSSRNSSYSSSSYDTSNRVPSYIPSLFDDTYRRSPYRPVSDDHTYSTSYPDSSYETPFSSYSRPSSYGYSQAHQSYGGSSSSSHTSSRGSHSLDPRYDSSAYRPSYAPNTAVTASACERPSYESKSTSFAATPEPTQRASYGNTHSSSSSSYSLPPYRNSSWAGTDACGSRAVPDLFRFFSWSCERTGCCIMSTVTHPCVVYINVTMSGGFVTLCSLTTSCLYSGFPFFFLRSLRGVSWGMRLHFISEFPPVFEVVVVQERVRSDSELANWVLFKALGSFAVVLLFSVWSVMHSNIDAPNFAQMYLKTLLKKAKDMSQKFCARA